jgi:deazaflavin-dependent oxidoreductase (nitroreductase family)
MSTNEARIAANAAVIAQFRANKGEVAGFEATPLLLLTTTGATTGATRVSPVTYLGDGDHWVVFAANGGRDHHPAWYGNLLADPHATVEVGGDTVPVVARVSTGPERTRLWDAGVAAMPQFEQFHNATDRVIPVVVLERST